MVFTSGFLWPSKKSAKITHKTHFKKPNQPLYTTKYDCLKLTKIWLIKNVLAKFHKHLQKSTIFERIQRENPESQ